MILRVLLALLLAIGSAWAKPAIYFGGGYYLTYYDFTTGAIDSRITASGGTNGTTGNNAGNIVAASAPRFNYSQNAPFAPLGVLAEPAATNLAWPSAGNFNSIAPSNATVVDKNAVGPDGTMSASTFTDNNTNNSHAVTFNVNSSAGVTYYVSVYFKAGTDFRLQMRGGAATFNSAYANFNANTGTVTALGNGAFATILTPVGNGFYRASLAMTASSTGSNTIGLYRINTDTNGSGVGYIGSGTSIIIYGVQVETFLSTYIPTLTGAVTRSADAITIPIPANVGHLYCTFSDGTTQNNTVTPSANFTLPTVTGKSYAACGGLQ